MKTIQLLLGTAALTAVVVLALIAFGHRAEGVSPSAPSPKTEYIERGRYLVHQVGMCIDCHSPRKPTGEFVEDSHLTGSPLAFAPTVPMPWSGAAPRIAGLPAGFTEEDTVHFLMTGERPHGRPAPLPPMPPYRFGREDAEAIVAYLRSLPAAAP